MGEGSLECSNQVSHAKAPEEGTQGATFSESFEDVVVGGGTRTRVEIVRKEEGEMKGSARRSMYRGCYYTTASTIEV